MDKKVHIIIPSYNGWSMTLPLLWGLYKKEKDNISSILIVDDFSNDDGLTENGVGWWNSQGLLPISLSQPFSENKGFLRIANSGLQMYQEFPRDDIVVLISNDVLIHGKFIQQILDIFNSNSRAVVGGVLYSHDTGWNTFGDKTFAYLEGWLLATTVLNWQKLNYFDERYAPCDYEDVDLSTTALKLGMDLVPLNTPSVHHLGGKTIGYNEARLSNTKKNQQLFREKWVSSSP